MKKILNSIKIGNFFEKIFCYILILFGFSNERIQVMEVRCKKYNFLKRKYFKKIDLNLYNNNISNEKSDYIWFCWLQGYDNMPSLVKKCYERILEFHSDSNIVFIDSYNYSNYIAIPDYIINKWKKGIISHAHFSDVIRTSLIAQYGGLWIDATTYLLSPIPKYIFDNQMFMFDMSNEDNIMVYNNWFIYSNKNNRIFLALRDYLYLFWKKENKVREYFVWHLFMRHIYNFYKEDFANMLYIPHECTHLMIKVINKKFDEEYLAIVNSMCPIQKLSYYKFETLDEKISGNIKDTYYKKLLDGKLK